MNTGDKYLTAELVEVLVMVDNLMARAAILKFCHLTLLWRQFDFLSTVSNIAIC